MIWVKLPTLIVILLIVAIVVLRKMSWPDSVSNGFRNGFRDIARNVVRALLMVGILLGVTAIGFHVLHFEISPAWTQTILAFTIAGFFAGALGNAIFDRAWPK